MYLTENDLRRTVYAPGGIESQKQLSHLKENTHKQAQQNRRKDRLEPLKTYRILEGMKTFQSSSPLPVISHEPSSWFGVY